MFDEVEYLKTTKLPSPEESIEIISKFCEENSVDIPTLLKVLIRSSRQLCSANFIDDADFGECHDLEGEHVAFGLDVIAEAYGYNKDRIKCCEVNKHGCCAEINRMLSHLMFGLLDCVKESKNEAGGQISGSTPQE